MNSRRVVIVVSVAVSMFASAAQARAAKFSVNSVVDSVDSNVGDGRCASSAAHGGCTLRAAVQEAGAAGGSTVSIPAGRYRLSIPPADNSLAGSAQGVDSLTGDLVISNEMTIKGAGAGKTVIDAGGLDRVFAINQGGIAHLSEMTITGADASRGATSQGIALGGAILNNNEATLDRMELVGNLADGGGGMFSIPGTHPIVRDSLIADNRSYSGGGLRLDSGATITNTTITGNQLMPVPDPKTAVTQRPFPVLFALAVDEGSGWGGGIDNRGGGDVVIVNSTITDNHGIKGGGGVTAGQGYAPVSPAVALGKMTLQNTIVAGNTSEAGEGNCHVKDQIIESLGHNIDTDGTCFLTAPGDLPKTDPKLGPLADNGGPTRTQALLPGSPGIDGGGAEGCPKTDQRGTARPQGAACDIGAFEAAPSGARACLRPATIWFKLHRVEGTRVVRVEAFVNGQRKLVRSGRDIRRIELNKLARSGKLKVRIVATHSSGSKLVSTRSWVGCAKGKVSVRRIPRPR
jgi:CSLREA domain-containing protein